ncbi:hypothetical protein LPB41_30925 [Thalassospira sp. MA62]|nr:hypothetical protein [Thalassospira sp. MA62]
MCGIAGATALRDHTAVSQCLKDLAHRGPDGTGIWKNHDQTITLGCARLATTGLGPDAAQPIQSADQRFVLVFNGYIAGHRRQIQRLGAKGAHFNSDNDAELVLHVLANAIMQGQDIASALAVFSGQYALALLDRDQGCLWLARDPLGIKPLYVMTRSEGDIAFASELSPLGAFGALIPDPNVRAAYLAHLFVPAPQTGTKNVRQLNPGQVLCWHQRTCRETTIPSPMARPMTPTPSENIKPLSSGRSQPSRNDLVVMLRDAVRQSVIDAMDADCDVGCLVSGGLDSAGVAALACASAHQMDRSLPPAFVMGFSDPRLDETAQAKNLCEHLGQSLAIIPAPEDGASVYHALCSGLHRVGGPFGNPSIVLIGHLSQEVGKNVRVCLTGDGGDEMFGGYPRYRAAHLYDQSAPFLPSTIRRWGRALTRPVSGASSFGRLLLGITGTPAQAFDQWNNRCCLDALNGKLATGLPAGKSLLDAMMEFDRTVTLPGNQLVMSDRCGMAAGLEYRVPLLGHDVARFVSQLPGAWHLAGGAKALWRDAIAPFLPDGHMDHPKIGFNPPVADWLQKVCRHVWGEEGAIMRGLFAQTEITSVDQDVFWRRAVSGRDPHMALSVWALMVWQIWMQHTRTIW